MGDESSRMLFNVSGFVFAVEVFDLMEVAEIAAERISVSEDGLFPYKYDFRGKAIPVVDMTTRVGGNSKPLEGVLELLVIEVDTHPFALIVDKVLGVIKGGGVVYRFPEMLRTEENSYIKSMYKLKGTLYLILQPASVLSEAEAAELRVP